MSAGVSVTTVWLLIFVDTATTQRNGNWYRFNDETFQYLDSVKVPAYMSVYVP